MEKSGIYHIRHTVTGRAYVGQTVDITRRWKKHLAELSDGTHHSYPLRTLWFTHGEDAFEFVVVKYSPVGISDLERQRWLVKEERSEYQRLVSLGLSLNVAAPKIVSTQSASKEWLLEQKSISKVHDQTVSMNRKLIKVQLEKLQREQQPIHSQYQVLSRDIDSQRERIRSHTGFIAFLLGRTSGFNKEAEYKKLTEQEIKLLPIASKNSEISAKISALKEQDKMLYRKFTKVQRQIIRRISPILRRVPDPTIGE